jgi:hypothetical protein
MSQNLDELVSLPWKAKYEVSADGDFCVTVAELPDFRFYTEKESELSEWVGAFRAHLDGYLATETPVPVPLPVQLLAPQPILTTQGGAVSVAVWEVSRAFKWQRSMDARYQLA